MAALLRLTRNTVVVATRAAIAQDARRPSGLWSTSLRRGFSSSTSPLSQQPQPRDKLLTPFEYSLALAAFAAGAYALVSARESATAQSTPKKATPTKAAPATPAPAAVEPTPATPAAEPTPAPVEPTPATPAVEPPATTESAKPNEDDGSANVFASHQRGSHTVQYLLIGAGTASHFAMLAILERDPNAKVLIISDDAHRPYARPPLSKEAWARTAEHVAASSPDSVEAFSFPGASKPSDLHYVPSDKYITVEALPEAKTAAVALMTNRKVVSVDPYMKQAVLDNDIVIHYDKCLIATGGFPRSLPVFDTADNKVRHRVELFRTVEDFNATCTAVDSAKRVAVIGGGFLGSELAAAIATRGRSNGLKVEYIIRENGPLEHVLPEYLSTHTTDQLRADGVNVHTQSQVTSATPTDNGVRLQLSNGSSMDVDQVVVAVGVTPRTDLASGAHLEIDNKNGGILANAELEARTDLWVAGDVVSFYDISLGRRRVEHHDHAAVTGRLAGLNMTGARRPFYNQSMFWSEIGSKISLEGVGIVDSSLETVAVWGSEKQDDKNLRKGVVFYMRDKHVVGVLLWNVKQGISVARKIVGSDKEYNDVKTLARFFELHDQ